jgi:D-glycero-alpha-D-manno-heptose-7-phosphate kinase
MPRSSQFAKIRARAPLRLGLAGGGTDISPYCDEYGGAVLNVTIDRFAFASCIPRDDARVVFEADDIGLAEDWTEDADGSSKLRLHRGVYRRMIKEFNGGRHIPLTLRTTVDAPAGSGLGSSSSLVVAMVDALREILSAPLGPYEVARLAYDIERVDLGLSGGRQDQYAAAFGGINYIEFLPGGRVVVNPLRARRNVFCELESSLVVCFSGQSRESANIIDEQTAVMKTADGQGMEALHQLKDDAEEMKRAFTEGDIDRMAAVLRSSWEAKKATASGVSNRRIDDLLQLGLDNGALAGKVSGAGGGGFIFFFVHPENRYRLMSALNDAEGRATSLKFVESGCETWTFR